MSRKKPAEKVAAIISRLREGGTSEQVAAEFGISLGSVAAYKAHLKRETYPDDATLADSEAELADALETKFGLERDLQRALRRNIGQLEPGLEIIDGGKERSVASGRIDITARDERGAVTVIELKAGAADWDAVGQIQAYMGDLMDEGGQVRGLLVAQEFTQRAVSAARRDPLLRLVGYRFQFAFEMVGGV